MILFLAMITASVFVVTFYAIPVAIVYSYITKKHEGLRIWLTIMMISCLAFFLTRMIEPFTPSFMGEERLESTRIEYIVGGGNLVIYSLVVFIPIRLFEKRIWQYIAYSIFVLGFCFAFIAPLLLFGNVLRTPQVTRSIVYFIMDLFLVPVGFLYILHLRKHRTQKSKMENGAKKAPGSED